MTDSRAALGSDRLPWLSDEPALAKAKARKAALPNPWPLAVVLLLALVAAGAYWLGMRGAFQQQQPVTFPHPSTVVPLPEAQNVPPPQQVEIAPQPEVVPAPAPEVRAAPQREVRIEKPRAIKRIIVRNPEAPTLDAEEKSKDATPEPTAVQKPAPAVEKPLKAWPATQSAGAKGRIVRIGAFATRQQAKLGWRSMVRSYPAVAHLKATVVSDVNSRGRHFYRFQIGTTSQAHSEVLCQRMEHIHFSCAVVGLPWKPKGVER